MRPVVLWQAVAERDNRAGSRADSENVPVDRDLPSAFRWASASYRPATYDGPVALLLSEDVLDRADNVARLAATGARCHRAARCAEATWNASPRTSKRWRRKSKPVYADPLPPHSLGMAMYPALLPSPDVSVKGVRVWSAQVDELTEAAVAELQQQLSVEETARAARFRFERDRKNYVVTRGLLRCLLGEILDESPASLRFAYGPHGKPQLAAPSTERFTFQCLALFRVGHVRGGGSDARWESIWKAPSASIERMRIWRSWRPGCFQRVNQPSGKRWRRQMRGWLFCAPGRARRLTARQPGKEFSTRWPSGSHPRCCRAGEISDPPHRRRSSRPNDNE